jgi:hypothetical protein
METSKKKNMYDKLMATAYEYEQKIMSLHTEMNYLKIACMEQNERNILNSCGVLGLRLGSLTDTMKKIVSANVDIVKEIKINKDDAKAISVQINEANKKLFEMTNAFTNYLYFLRENGFSS